MPPHPIPLQHMPQQALAGPGNDWTGISDPKARKKLQDRVHQRISHLGSFAACEPDSERTERFILQFTTNAHLAFLRGSPRAEMLLNLVQFNTTRALVTNARIMGITHEIMSPKSRSWFPSKGGDISTHDSLPPSLRPTLLQLTVSHHPWIDILPLPEIRDNLLRHDEKSYDNKELCRDLRGFQAVALGCGGMITWADPWDSRGWEVTEAFAAKWPWVIEGCHELLDSTNHWKAARDGG
ncbi:hypothetical protein B0J13DRAFT_584975 [Dactylonectria estremocensis]|uniref:Uncharacterized protein n=1 Tax=Dactylonectria estremocensis TaxID=1079267 RepID=A0A9P9J124_9HYPO|nr:hypothetical protein B0J13DRAFT_584975 [Dactylonectria estremocensis]